MKPDDWVVIEIDFHLPPRPSALYMQSLYGQQALNPQTLQALQSAGQNQGMGQGGASPGGGQQSSADQLSDDDKARLSGLMSLIRNKNPYRLTRDPAR